MVPHQRGDGAGDAVHLVLFARRRQKVDAFGGRNFCFLHIARKAAFREEGAGEGEKFLRAETRFLCQHDAVGVALRFLQLAVELVRPCEIGISHGRFRPVHGERHGHFLRRVNEGGDDVNLLRRHAIEAINPHMGAANGFGFGDFSCQEIEETSLIGKVSAQVLVVSAIEERQIRRLLAQRRVPFPFGGVIQLFLRHAEHIQLVEEVCELFREMGIAGGAENHLQLVFVFL